MPPRVSLGSKPSGLAVFLVPEGAAHGSFLLFENNCSPQARSRRDLHSLVTRLTTVCLDDFGFGTLAWVR